MPGTRKLGRETAHRNAMLSTLTGWKNDNFGENKGFTP